ncbi:MAG TPA: carotenoid oxygenase family protein [Azospirillaceae bacterium]|nr:carotenoid oxygenase family protein [Azospirillaceae bacterium]
MNRRDFLKATGSAALLAGLPLPALAVNPAVDDWAAAFHQAMKTRPWLAGWAGQTGDRAVPALMAEGRLPPGLNGTYYRNGPAGHEIAGLRYRHWFDADGMVHAWKLGPEGASWRCRFVDTQKRAREQAAGRALVPAFGTVPEGASTIPMPDTINPANINALPHAGKLLALWEAGSAYELDPETLETKGVVTWREDLKGVAFSAHPKVEPDGTLWNFGVNYIDGRMILWRVNPDGTLHTAAEIPGARHLGFLHDMAVTERSLVFLLSPVMLSRPRFLMGNSFLDSLDWEPERGTIILAVDKDDFSRQRRWQLPASFGFHFGNAWEEADGTIRFDYALADDASVLFDTLRHVMRGALVPPTALPRETMVTLSPNGRSRVEALGPELAEFPRVDPRVVGRRNRQIYHLARTVEREMPLFNAVIRRDLETGTADAFDYGPDTLAEEHVFVPRPGGAGETDGWVVGTALDVRRGATGVNVFDARRLADGPVMRAWLPFPVPLGLHGNFHLG